MALFGKVDENLPLLTQFYQVSIPDLSGDGYQPDKDELTEFLVRNGMLPDVAYFVADPKQRLGLLSEFAGVHKMVVELMDALADDGEVCAPTLLWLETKVRERTPIQTMVFDRGDGLLLHVNETTWEPSFRARSLTLQWVHGSSVFDKLVDGMGALLDWRKRAAVSRCQECKNPFIEVRLGQMYCSHRCSNRRIQRERKRQVKKEYKVVAE